MKHAADPNIQVRPLDAVLEDRYEAFVRDHPGGLLHYSLRYKRLLEAVVDAEPQYFVALRGGDVCGVLPLFVAEGPFGKVVNSLPYYGSHGGALAASGAAAAALMGAYDEIVEAAGVASATIVENPLVPPATPVASDVTDRRIGQLTALQYAEDHAEQLMAAFHYKTRNMIRKAQKEGVTCAVQNDAWSFLQAVHDANMQAKGGMAKRPRFFEAVPQLFEPDDGYRIYVARLEGEAIAALLLFYYNGVVEYFTPVVKVEHRSAQPMSLLIYRAMVDASERGYRLWNWGGTWPSQQSLHRFKKRWATEDRPYIYHVRVRNEALWHATPKALLQAYPNLYVVPFGRLTG